MKLRRLLAFALPAALGALPFKFFANARIDAQFSSSPEAIHFTGEMCSKLG